MNSRPFARLTPVGGGSLAFRFAYDPELVTEFKAQVPATARRWDAPNRQWLIDPSVADTCANLAERHLGVKVYVPPVARASTPETTILRLEYLGRCKTHGDESFARGWVNGAWSTIWPETVLKAYFDPIPVKPGEKPSLYSILSLTPEASTEEIKRSFRRLAMQWHPDVCREPDATEQFKRVHHAYEVLFDAMKRRKYDAGRMLEASLNEPYEQPYLDRYLHLDGYRSPLRCGLVMASGLTSVTGFTIGEIFQWLDIQNDAGQTLVTHWPRDADHFQEQWV